MFCLYLLKSKKNNKFSQPCPPRKSGGGFGFTLIELLVAITIFSLVVGVAAGIFTMGLRAQRRSLATQELLSQTSYLIEYMSRALRMARKDTGGICIDTNLNYEKTKLRTLGGKTYFGPGIRFINHNGICQEFFRDDIADFQLKESKGGAAPVALTSPDLRVLAFNIGPDDSWKQYDHNQPRVTLFFNIQGREGSRIKIQTTVSQRNPDIRIGG